MKSPRFLVLLTLLAGLLTCPAQTQLKVGFAKADITPQLEEDRPVWIAGYGPGRRATAIHDPLIARCAVLSDGAQTFALVGVDLVGLQLPEIDRIRAKLSGIDRLIVGSSHNHEGPDVVGIWGRSPVKSGIDPEYLELVVDQVAKCVAAAQKDMQPMGAKFGRADDASLLGDSRLPKALDPTLRLLRFNHEGDEKPTGLIVQWNCHPEAMGSKNTELTADFVAATVETLEKKYACPVVYLTGAVGGLMAPPDGRIRNADGEVLKEGDWEYSRLYGVAVAGLASKAADSAQPIQLTPFSSAHREVYLPVRNPYYRAAFTAGVLNREAFVDEGDPFKKGKAFALTDTFKKMAIRTEVNVLRLGKLDLLGIPGEIYPELVYGKFQDPVEAAVDFPEAPLEPTVAKLFDGREWMLIGLANDEIGYIIPKRQWDNEKPYAYGRDKSQYGELNSCSPDSAPILMDALKKTRDDLTSRPTRLLSYNVWYGFGKKPERKAKCLRWIKDQRPDIVALQELNGYSEKQLAEDAASWGHKFSALLKPNGFPTGLTSRFPIESVERIREGFHHGLLRCKTGGLVVYVIHFHPSDWTARIREARLLLADIKKLPAGERDRVVLIGDFNGFSPLEKEHLEKDGELAEFFEMLDQRDRSKNLNDGKLDYQGIQAFHDAGYVDLIHKHLKKDSPYPGTFPTRLRPDEDMGRDRRLDYVFVPETLAAKVKAARVVRDKTTSMLSDHYPLILDLTIPK